MTQAPPPGAENDPGGYPSTPPPQPSDPGQQAGYPAAPPPPGQQTPQQGYPAAPPPPAANYGQPAAPGTYGQPATPGAYGQPPAPAGGGQISFDASKVTKADWALFGVGVLMFIFSFMGWLTGSSLYGSGSLRSGWGSWWFLIQLVFLAVLIVRALQVFAGMLKKEIPGIALVGAAGGVVVLTLIALIQSFATSACDVAGVSGDICDSVSDSGVNVGPGFGIWAYFILSIVFFYLVTLAKQKEGPLPFKVPSVAGL